MLEYNVDEIDNSDESSTLPSIMTSHLQMTQWLINRPDLGAILQDKFVPKKVYICLHFLDSLLPYLDHKNAIV